MTPDTFFTPWLIWFILGIVLAFVELSMPGFIVLFFGIGCWITAGTLLLWEISLTRQIFIFLISSITSLVLLRKWLMRTFRGVSADNPDKEFDDFPLGKRVRVLKTIGPDAAGRIQYRGTSWNAVAEETIAADEIVEITSYADNSRQVFKVRKIT